MTAASSRFRGSIMSCCVRRGILCQNSMPRRILLVFQEIWINRSIAFPRVLCIPSNLRTQRGASPVGNAGTDRSLDDVVASVSIFGTERRPLPTWRSFLASFRTRTQFTRAAQRVGKCCRFRVNLAETDWTANVRIDTIWRSGSGEGKRRPSTGRQNSQSTAGGRIAQMVRAQL